MNSLWDRIKHKNVVKVATAYGFVCWILLQIQDAVLPTIGAPLWVAQIILFIILIGFPIACLIAWASESSNPIDSSSYDIKENQDKPEKNIPVSKTSLALISLVSLSVIGLFAFYVSPYIFDYTPKKFSNNLNTPLTINKQRSPRYDLNIDSSLPNEWGLNSEIAISPNGQYVAYTKNSDGSSEIFLRDLYATTSSVSKLASYTWGTDVHGIIFFSKDSQWVSYFDSGILKKVKITGGPPQVVLENALGRTSGYDLYDDILIYTGTNDHLYEYNIIDNTSKVVSGFSDMETRVYRWPQLLPDKENIIVTSASLVSASDDSNLILYNRITGEHEVLIPNAFNARYIPQTGHLIFTRVSSLYAVPFDLENLALTGIEVEVIRNIETNGILGSSAYSVSNDGRLIYLIGSDVAVSEANLSLNIVNRSGELTDEIPISGRVGQLSLSNDNKKLAYTAYEGSQNDIWVWDFEKSISGRRTFDGISGKPIWYKNDDYLIHTNRSESMNISGISAIRSNGTGEPLSLLSMRVLINGIQSVSDHYNKLFFFTGLNNEELFKQSAIYSIDINLDNSVINSPILAEYDVTPNVDDVWWSRFSLSPDNNWLMYVSNESGSNQIYIRPYPDINQGKWQISAPNASSPIWSKNSNEIFFRSGSKFYSADYNILPGRDSSYININVPELMFEANITENHLTFPAWVHNPSSDTFIIITDKDDQENNGIYTDVGYKSEISLTVVENWFDELMILVPNNF
tara:strand:- start:3027 stop:5258 length:2232 start_codon:yes stop_codon:yes gene_type:complete